MERFDLIVIGAGPGGYVAALEAAQAGLHTAVVERGPLGGTCLNRGCIPTKTLLHTALLAAEAKRGAAIGLRGEITVDFDALRQRKNDVARQLSEGIGQLFSRQKIALFSGSARITGPETVQVESEGQLTQILSAERILVATGGESVRLPIPGLDLPGVFDSEGLLDEVRPIDRLVIIGGGVIGMEFAGLYAALGSQVTVLEAAGSILANLDREFGQSLKMLLKKQGADIHTGVFLTGIERSEEGLICRYTEKEAERSVTADAVLTAVGRRPAVEGLFDPAFLPAMEKGCIAVDEHYRTSLPGIWAVGDAIGGIQLAHLASAEGINAVHAMLGRPMPMRTDLVPSCVYTSPEIASVGLTADEAKRQGLPVTTRKIPMGANGKTVLEGQERSFMKLVSEPQTGRILGAQLMCGRATDLIGEFATAIANGLTCAQLAGVIRPHPTYEEAIGELTRE
ncbi:MAG: dihydrolipoyl dehydrogenase [Oscillospiraceae bacterium]|nr:MAG: dihydrolipoyl dehydrogenase [Oscillospiraceae bacterium]